MSLQMQWRRIEELKEPFNDAVNYKSKREKEFLSKIFLRTDELDQCLLPSTYYLIGEKGTGKTAYAVFLENNCINETACKLTTMTETQYKRFIALKKEKKLQLSDYANIWRSMLLLVVSQMIVEKSKSFHHVFTGKFSKIEKAISMWNDKALNPEVESAFEILVSETLTAKLSNEQVGEAGGEQLLQQKEKSSVIRHHLLETETLLKKAIANLRLSKSHILFIDGIDFRPEGVSYAEYIECIKGLSEAAWQLNTEFFNSIKDSKGRVKIVLLVRPDVFHKLNLYNSNSRLQDNCVFLDWSTIEREFKSSNLFDAGGRYFANQQQSKVDSMQAWNQYFGGHENASKVFKRLLRTTFQKPRDVLTYIKISRRRHVKKNKGCNVEFDESILSDSAITREFADYLLGEVRNYATFYMSATDFGIYLKYFQYLNGKQIFAMSDFESAFDDFKKWVGGEEVKNQDYLADSESLLQFFYDVNVIGYQETAIKDGEDFYHWSYRDRSINNISPKVKAAEKLMLNPGIAKALDIGKETARASFVNGDRSNIKTNQYSYHKRRKK